MYKRSLMLTAVPQLSAPEATTPSAQRREGGQFVAAPGGSGGGTEQAAAADLAGSNWGTSN